MKITLSTTRAAYMLLDDKNASWSYEGATALVEYLEQLEEDTGEEIDFDVVAIRCEWSEHASLAEYAEDSGYKPDGDTDEEREEDVRRYVDQYGGVIIEFSGGVIVSSF